MSIVVNTNMPAMYARNAMNETTKRMNISMIRLSTGNRINSAKDDPAGAFYASRVSTELRGIQVAYQNVGAASTMLATAEGDLSIVNQHLERIKELANQYANDSLSDNDKLEIKSEVSSRVEEINRIAHNSEFNNVKLLDGTKGDTRIQVGTKSQDSSNSITIRGVFGDVSTGASGLGLFGGTYADIDAAFADSSSAAGFLSVVDDAIKDVSSKISTIGVYQNRFDSVANLLISRNENLTSAYSAVVDTDIAMETANYVKYQILQQTASAVLTQANQASGVIALKLVSALG